MEFPAKEDDLAERFRWIWSTLLPEVGWPDPNPSDPNPDSTNRKSANAVDPVEIFGSVLFLVTPVPKF